MSRYVYLWTANTGYNYTWRFIMDIMKLKLNDITIDENLNVRELLDEDTITRYMECFEQLPPIVVFETDDGYLLADGFHRVEAAKRLEREEIEVNVMQGTRQAAEEHAAIANLKHGKPLTRAERGKAVEVMLKLHTERSDSWIADDMGVSKNTVAKYREELESNCQTDSCSTFITKDGRKYPREIKQPKKDEQTSDEQVDEQSRETMQEVPDEQPKVAEAEAISDEIEQGADAEPQAEQPETDAVKAQTDDLVDEVEQEASVGIAEISVTDNPLKESPEAHELSSTETKPQNDDTIDDDEDYADEKVDANLPASFWTNWNGLMTNYQKLVETCELKEIAQEFLNIPNAKRDMEKLRGFLDTISSLMKSLSSSDW